VLSVTTPGGSAITGGAAGAGGAVVVTTWLGGCPPLDGMGMSLTLLGALGSSLTCSSRGGGSGSCSRVPDGLAGSRSRAVVTSHGQPSDERSFTRRGLVEPDTTGNQQSDASRECQILAGRYARP
jgi:hypothetical protein